MLARINRREHAGTRGGVIYCRRLRERIVAQRREDRVPEDVEDDLHIAVLRDDDRDHILLGRDDYVLTECAVAAEAVVLTSPPLIAVAELPVGGLVHAVVRDRGGRLGDVALGKYAPTVPDAFIEVEHAELQHVLGRDVDSPAAVVHTVWRFLPPDILYAERIEEPRLQIVDHPHAGNLRDDRREHVGRGGVVGKMRPRDVLDIEREESLRPARLARRDSSERVLIVSGVHREHMAESHRR